MSYDVYIQRRDQLYVGEVPALPGCHTYGRTEEEVLENIGDVIEGYFHLLRIKRKPHPQVKVVHLWQDSGNQSGRVSS